MKVNIAFSTKAKTHIFNAFLKLNVFKKHTNTLKYTSIKV